jgi:dienelactone hydrolase
VTFTPKAKGTRSAVVSISDDGGASPQTVALSGTGCVLNQRRKCMTTISNLMVQSTLANSRTAAAPSTIGLNKVGTRVMDLIDSTRDNPFLGNGTKRELLVRFWYPASLNQECKSAEYTSRGVWSYFSQLTGLPLPDVTTNSCLDAPITDGAHPTVVFTHGYTGTFTDYTFLFEDLASRGYIVVSIDHTYEATAVEFPDGRFVKSTVGSHLANTWQIDDKTLRFVLSVRLKDLTFVVDELDRLNTTADSPFFGKLDTSRLALMGHSLGGEATLSGMHNDMRFKAGVILDGVLSDAAVIGTDKAVLLLAAGREQWSEQECRLWSALSGPRLAVNLRGTEHLTPSDAVWLARGAVKTGNMGLEKAIAAVRDYIAAFLDTNIQDRRLDLLLTGPSSDYPDVTVTTQRQTLCSGMGKAPSRGAGVRLPE